MWAVGQHGVPVFLENLCLLGDGSRRSSPAPPVQKGSPRQQAENMHGKRARERRGKGGVRYIG